MSKVCKQCDKPWSELEFPKGNASTCKACRKSYHEEWRKNNRLDLREKGAARMRKYRATNPELRERELVYRREYARNNREKILTYATQRQAEGKQFINSFKNKPCLDCGQSFPPHVMDFDHVTGEKELDISLMGSFSLEKIKAEIAKCDLVCANCHRIRTYNRYERNSDNQPPIE